MGAKGRVVKRDGRRNIEGKEEEEVGEWGWEWDGNVGGVQGSERARGGMVEDGRKNRLRSTWRRWINEGAERVRGVHEGDRENSRESILAASCACKRM